MSTVLPLDASPEERSQPWLLHLLEVNTMNFCTFACCPPAIASTESSSEMLIAVPNTLASEAVSNAMSCLTGKVTPDQVYCI